MSIVRPPTRRTFISASLAISLPAADRPPNIVFILVDDLRWDELHCTGHPFAQSPNADRLSREGANFKRRLAYEEAIRIPTDLTGVHGRTGIVSYRAFRDHTPRHV